MKPTKGKRLGNYARSAGLVALSVVLLVGMIVAIVGPRQVGVSLVQLRNLDQAKAGNLGGLASATGRDLRFGIAEGYKNQASKQAAIGWERLIFPWDQIQRGGPDDFNPDQVFTPDMLQAELGSGVQVVGLLQFTPGWAQSNGADGQRSIPKNLNQPWDAPDNYWGQFARKMAQHYAGKVDTWVIWNEPEIRPADAGGGSSWTWAGSPADYAQLLRVAYKNIKAGNPNAQVVFAGTAYWLDKNAGRPQFFAATLDALAADPNAAANDFYFDAAGFNIYRAPDDIYRIAVEMRAVMKAKGLDKPLWLTETNAMPFDPAVPCSARFQGNPSNVDLDTQAAYAVQSAALALAAGWQRIEFYQMTDSDTCAESSIWGLARDDGSLRPAFTAYKTAIEHLKDAQNVSFLPYLRDTQAWGTPWPDDPNSYYPNWQVYQVVADKGDQRVSILWNGDGQPLRARIPKVGTSAVRIDKLGNQQPLDETNGWYVVELAPARARGPFDPEGYYYIGGDPAIIIQSGVPAGTAPAAPGIGDPGSQAKEFKVLLSPENGQKAVGGQTVSFTLQVRGFEGFSDAVHVKLKEYSTQRDPAPKPSLPGTLSLSVPDTVQPGQTATATVTANPGIQNGIHYITLQLDGGGITRTVDLVVQVD